MNALALQLRTHDSTCVQSMTMRVAGTCCQSQCFKLVSNYLALYHQQSLGLKQATHL